MEKEKLVQTVKLAQKGDSDALNELFNAFYNDVYYFALKNVKDEDLACDITQEAFVEIINTLDNLKEPAAFVTWMKQITYHQCTRYFKKKKDVLVDENEDGDTIFDTMAEERTEFIPDEAVDQEDFRTTIMGMIDQLPDEQRAATMMYYFDEMSVKEIAQAQGVGENTVKGRLSYSRKAIKKSVEDYEKKNNVKLHCVGLLPLLLWLFQNYGKAMPVASAKAVAEGVSTATGVGICVAAGSGAVAATVTTTAAVGLGAKIAAIPLFAKITAAVVAATIAVSAVAIGMNRDGKNNPAPTTLQNQNTHQDFPTTPEPTENDDMSLPPQDNNTSTPPDENTSPPPEDDNTPVPPVNDNTSTPPEDDDTPVPPVDDDISTPPEDNNTDTPAVDTDPVGTFYVPDGCYYSSNYLDNHNYYSAGEKVTEPLSEHDSFSTKDYIYYYSAEGWNKECPYMGWAVTLRNNEQTSYEPILAEIRGVPVVSLNYTFEDCKKLETAPQIPDTIKTMRYTFHYCIKLSEPPTLPKSVEDLSFTFFSSGIQNTPEIPEGITALVGTFQGCGLLQTAAVIPKGVLDLTHTFAGCTRLVEVPELPEGIRIMDATFSYCCALSAAPRIPDSVIDMNETFMGCTAMVTAPDFPPNVINISAAYKEAGITESPVIPDSVLYAEETFAFSELRYAPVIPANIISAWHLFANCKKLADVIVIHAEFKEVFTDMYGNQCTRPDYLDLFPNVRYQSWITGTSSQLEEIAALYPYYIKVSEK